MKARRRDNRPCLTADGFRLELVVNSNVASNSLHANVYITSVLCFTIMIQPQLFNLVFVL